MMGKRHITEEAIDAALTTLTQARKGTRGPIPRQAMRKALEAAMPLILIERTQERAQERQSLKRRYF